jgi:hypothetical protein
VVVVVEAVAVVETDAFAFNGVTMADVVSGSAVSMRILEVVELLETAAAVTTATGDNNNDNKAEEDQVVEDEEAGVASVGVMDRAIAEEVVMEVAGAVGPWAAVQTANNKVGCNNSTQIMAPEILLIALFNTYQFYRIVNWVPN